LPKRKLLVPGRAVIFLIATLALGPGLLVNVVLKDHWAGRARSTSRSSAVPMLCRWWIRAATARTTARSCPAMSPARSGP